VRSCAAQQLVQLRVPHLLLPAFTDASPSVRLIAVDGASQLIEEIQLASESKSTAAGGFGRQAGARDLRALMMAALLQLLGDNERQIRKEAASVLQLLGDDDWTAAFPSADGPPAFSVLADSERPEVMDLLIDLLTVQEAGDRKLAAQLLGLRLEVNAAAMLRVAARDPVPEVRVQALHSLGELRDREGVAAVTTALYDKVPAVRHAALLASGKLGDISALPHVLQCMVDSDEKVQGAAAGTLHQLQGPGALEALIDVGMLSTSEFVRRGTVASLARWSDAAAVHAALKSRGIFGKPPKGQTKQRWAEVRASGCEVLGHLFHHENRPSTRGSSSDATSALQTLVDFGFKDKDEEVRLQAVLAAGKLRLCEALVHLMSLLQDSSPLIVDATISTIGSLDWTRYLKPNEKILKHGVVLKPIKGGRPRCVVLTENKRMFYIDANTLEAKDLELFAASEKSPQVLLLKRKRKKVKVQVVINSAMEWVDAVRQVAEGELKPSPSPTKAKELRPPQPASSGEIQSGVGPRLPPQQSSRLSAVL